MASVNEKLDHLEWTISSRHKNQLCSLKLLKLFENHEKTWKTKKFARAAQDLIAVAFSLWRAAFLAEKTGKRVDVFEHGAVFLEKVIEDNAISYLQDKMSREWTFNYYTRNARASLEILHKHWPKVAPEYHGKSRNAKARWEYCQQLLDETVLEFEKLLSELASKADQLKRVQARRTERRRNRAKVRTLTLTRRKRQTSTTI